MSPQPERQPRKPATILDVAAAAGVSRQTVTRAMNAMPGIKASTMERVLQAAHELGYAPSRFARGLVQGSEVSVGLAIPDLENPYFPAFASSVVEHATARGWHVVVDDFGHGGRTAMDAVERLAPQVDAIIGYVGEDADGAAHLMGRRPLVALDNPVQPACASIDFDYHHAAAEAIHYLRASGRRRIVYLDASGRGGLSNRAKAFQDVMSEVLGKIGSSVSPEPTGHVVVAPRDSAAVAAHAAQELLLSRPDTDAIVVFNDLMAAGVLKGLTAAGRRVPADIAVVGMDGIPLGELLTPALTTLALDLREVGRTAVEVLAGLLAGDIELGGRAAHRIIRPTLRVRESA